MTIGIYAVVNKTTGKYYIGKSKNIERRWISHRCNMKQEICSKDFNRYLHNAALKYGVDDFEFIILQKFSKFNDEQLSEAELFWIEFYDSTNSELGYNLRKDSSSNMIVHDDTRKLLSELNSGEGNPNFGNRWSEEAKLRMSEIKKQQFNDGLIYNSEWRAKISSSNKGKWNDPIKKNNMIKKVSELNSELRFYQYDKNTLELVRVWESMYEILESNPDYHRISIYSVCNGHKKSYRGFVWKSELKEK